MTAMENSPASNPSVTSLAHDCAVQTSRHQTLPPSSDPCYELFRRALIYPHNDAAWQALMWQYQRLVLRWLGPYADDDACQEVFIHFWKALRDSETPLHARFPNTAAVLGYLKQCVFTVRTDLKREEERRIQVEEILRSAALADLVWLRTRPDDADAETDLQQVIADHLKPPQEQTLFDLRYRYGLLPQEIQACRPDLFPDVQAVYRVQENLIKRLRRDAVLKRLWLGQSLDGGNGPDLSV